MKGPKPPNPTDGERRLLWEHMKRNHAALAGQLHGRKAAGSDFIEIVDYGLSTDRWIEAAIRAWHPDFAKVTYTQGIDIAKCFRGSTLEMEVAQMIEALLLSRSWEEVKHRQS